jgi:hypothetical protein
MQQDSDDLYERLIAANREAFTGGFYETAYHALAAALHRAQDIGALHLLVAVEQLATEEMAHIDLYHPAHTLSSQSAKTRGLETLYRSLAKQSATRRAILAWRQTREKV